MDWSFMVPILVALIGLGSALVAGYFAGRRQARLEQAKEARLAVAEVAKSISMAVLVEVRRRLLHLSNAPFDTSNGLFDASNSPFDRSNHPRPPT